MAARPPSPESKVDARMPGTVVEHGWYFFSLGLRVFKKHFQLWTGGKGGPDVTTDVFWKWYFFHKHRTRKKTMKKITLKWDNEGLCDGL